MDKPSMAHLIPNTLLSKKDILFGNMPEIYQFHKTYTSFYLQLFIVYYCNYLLLPFLKAFYLSLVCF